MRLRVGLILGWLLLGVAPAFAEPYFAVREGLRCSACHTNMTGGGKRTDLVNTHARELLHYSPSLLGNFSNPPEYLTGEINQFFAVGADLRASETATFQDLGSNGRVNNDKVWRDRLETNSIDVTETVLYGEFRLIPDTLILYVDQRLQPQTTNREAFGMLKLPWYGTYVKAGQMFLPYGLQLQDDGAFIRGGTNGSANTGFSFNVEQPAFEIGLEPGPFTFVTAVSQGVSNDRDVQVTMTASALLTDVPVVRNALAGFSFSRVGPPGSQTTVFGPHIGTNYERLTVLGEADFRDDKNSQTNGNTIGRFICYGEGDYLFLGWLNFKVAVDYSDNDGTLGDTNDAENRVRFGLEPFLNRFLQPRLFYSISNGVESNATHNQNVLTAEVHVFF